MFYKNKNTKNYSRGVTLIEMMVVLAIFGILLSIVVFNYNKFTDDTVLTNMAYEVALSVREAQLFGTAVKGQTSEFGHPVGLYFTQNSDSYVLFIDNNNDLKFNPLQDTTYNTLTLLRKITISGLEISSSGSCGGSLSSAVILFKRPDVEPYVGNNSSENTGKYKKLQIQLITKGGKSKYVIINEVGSIEVKTESMCSSTS